MINAASIKARLKNHAKESGHTLQNELAMFGLERTIYRISISPHAVKFTLKGGIFFRFGRCREIRGDCPIRLWKQQI